MKKNKYNVDSFVKANLRQASLKWPGKTDALKKARVERGKYKCDTCGRVLGMIKSEVVKKGKRRIKYKVPLEMDHIEPVVPLNGSIHRNNGRIDWNIYIDRLFVKPEGYSAKCGQCHDSKTAIENSMRQFYDKEKKKK